MKAMPPLLHSAGRLLAREDGDDPITEGLLLRLCSLDDQIADKVETVKCCLAVGETAGVIASLNSDIVYLTRQFQIAELDLIKHLTKKHAPRRRKELA